MSVNRYSAKRDANEPEIIDALEAIGCSVDRTPGGEGRPDLIVGFRGSDVRIEIKMPGEKLNVIQRRYHSEWKGAPIHVAYSIAEAIAIVTTVAKRKPCPKN